MNTGKRLLKYIVVHWKRIFIGFIFTLLMGLSDALLAPAAGLFIEAFSDISNSIQANQTISIHIKYNLMGLFKVDFLRVGMDEITNALFMFIIFLIASVVLKGIFVLFKELLMNSVVQKILMQVRNDIYSHVVHLPMRFFDVQKTGELMSRLTYDVNMLDSALNSFIVILQSLVYTIIFVAGMLLIDWQLTLLFLIIFPLLGITIKYFASKIKTINLRITTKLADISSFLQETLSSIKIVKSYTREGFEKDKFKTKTKENYNYSLKSVFLVALLKPANEIISTGGMVLIFMVCGLKLINGDLSIGDLTMFIGFLTMAYKPIKTLGETTEAVQKATVSAERIFEIFDTQNEPIKNATATALLNDVKGNIVFKDVSFSYTGVESTLSNINLNAKSGETIAFVGPSGGGKSTIINILMRFYEIESGNIFIDNKDISDVTLESLRSKMSLVPQETILFSGSVLDNIRYGNLTASKNEVIEAAKKANADMFIQNLPLKYKTEIGERGIQLSGGQRQRIAIARAILKNPKILLLDEATSALDVESENLVQDALEKLMVGRTTFVIAHRLSTIHNADRIYVIEKGTVVQSGNHDELIKEDGLYKRLYSIQFKENKLK